MKKSIIVSVLVALLLALNINADAAPGRPRQVRIVAGGYHPYYNHYHHWHGGGGYGYNRGYYHHDNGYHRGYYHHWR